MCIKFNIAIQYIISIKNENFTDLLCVRNKKSVN